MKQFFNFGVHCQDRYAFLVQSFCADMRLEHVLGRGRKTIQDHRTERIYHLVVAVAVLFNVLVVAHAGSSCYSCCSCLFFFFLLLLSCWCSCSSCSCCCCCFSSCCYSCCCCCCRCCCCPSWFFRCTRDISIPGMNQQVCPPGTRSIISIIGGSALLLILEGQSKDYI